MKSLFIKCSAIFSCIFMLAGVGSAQSINDSKFEIPFDFIVKDKVFSAGEYSIERLNQGNPNLLILKNSDGKQKTIFLTQNAGMKKNNQPRLSFKHYEDKYFLERVWLTEEGNGQQVLINNPDLKLPENEKQVEKPFTDPLKCNPKTQEILQEGTVNVTPKPEVR